MLSILIPCYNYNTYPLVVELYNQSVKENLSFEIIVQDDASNSELNLENEKIKSLQNCFFYRNNQNIGRGKNRNSLATKAKYNWILFLDCDTFPTKNDFIKKYIHAIQKHEVVFGGIKYQTKKPEQSQLLRWIYGKKREAISIKQRIKNPNRTALTSNLLIKKDVFLSNPFEDTILEYGYEDYLFFIKLEQKNTVITHIENTVIHLGLETSEEYLNKINISLKNLSYLYNFGLLSSSDNRILSVYSKINKFKLDKFFNLFFDEFSVSIKSNLMSNKPSLFLLDIYKLSYFCKINLK
ncbi:glycosyltransferase family 2 protein [Flavobacterium sp.]|uniref:glycosyltransferase family 2 protein n=1 Tax=Flavobacterium sp. TaxID=239 RepID=UPI003752A050